MIPRTPTTRPKLAALVVVVLLALAWLSGCASAIGYRTLAGVGHTTDTAVKSYFDLVVAGRVATNDVPKVSKAYGEFQILYRVALEVARFNPKAPPDTNITARASALLGLVSEAKGGQP